MRNPHAKKYGAFLRRLRMEKGLTMQQVADRVSACAGKSITEAYVSLIETGRRNPPHKQLGDAWAKVLGVTEEVVAYAAKGQWYRPIAEVLHARKARPSFIEAVKGHPLDHLKEIMVAHLGSELVITIKPDGTVDIACLEALL